MSSVLKRLWRILEANRTAAQEALGDDFRRDFQHWEERLRRKMKLNDDFEAFDAHHRHDFYRHRHEHQKTQTPTRDETIAGYYANLEIPYGADLETVKKAYRKLMKQYHPDKFSGDPEKQKIATEITKRLNEAYQALEKYLQSHST